MNQRCIPPRHEGTMAAHEGRGPSTNPYPPSIGAYYDWLEGYVSEIEVLSIRFDQQFGASQGEA